MSLIDERAARNKTCWRTMGRGEQPCQGKGCMAWEPHFLQTIGGAPPDPAGWVELEHRIWSKETSLGQCAALRAGR
jgi:hypothetical protein